jgi:hypothetical protein
MLPAATGAGTGNPNQMPFITLIRPSFYSLVGGTTIPKALVSNLPPAYIGYRGSNFVDVFDPAWQTSVNTWFSASDTSFDGGGTPSALDTNPFLIGVTMDDSDQAFGFKSGTHPNTGWMVGVSAPYMASEYVYDHSAQVVYADTKNYTKDSFKTYITGLYGTVGALNTAWSSTYSTLGSSATTVTGETIGTGNGVATSFNHTFAHTVVDPASIGISVGGTLQAGDCPWFNPNCSGDASGTGTIIAASVAGGNINGGTITYSSGAITVTFSSAPMSGTAITATYQYGGWPKATSGGTGLLDEDGTSAWYPASYLIGSQGGTAISGTVATDIDHYYPTFMTQYFSTIKTRLTAALPHHLVFGPDALNMYTGSYGKSQIYTVEGLYTDVLEIAGGSNDATTMAAVYAAAQKPTVVYFTVVANEDSTFYNVPNTFQNCVDAGWGTNTLPLNGCQHTQPLRGAFFYTQTSSWFTNYAGADTYHYILGWDWWQWDDNTSEQMNFGIVSLKDNLYNGTEDVNHSITDQYGYTTVAEAQTHGDFVTLNNAGIICANKLWLTAGVGCGAIPITVSISQQPPASLQINAVGTVAAITTNDGGSAGVDWTLTCGGGSCGSITAHTASGVAATYTAPTAVPPSAVVAKATSTTDNTKSASANGITITTAANVTCCVPKHGGWLP